MIANGGLRPAKRAVQGPASLDRSNDSGYADHGAGDPVGPLKLWPTPAENTT
jgi:hypothetical protein